MASKLQQPSSSSSNDSYQPLRNPISGHRLGGGTDLSIAEILALPEQERNELAERMGVISWEPFTIRAICTPGDVYSHVTRERLTTPAPIPDFDSDEESVEKAAEDHTPDQRSEGPERRKARATRKRDRSNRAPFTETVLFTDDSVNS